MSNVLKEKRKELYFADALTIGLGPGEAVLVRAGEVMAAPASIVEALLKRSGVVEASAIHADSRRVTLEERALPKSQAALVSPPLDDDRLVKDLDRAEKAKLVREKLAKLRLDAAA